MSKIFHARHAMGQAVRGFALVANDGFSARYDLDRNAGTFSRPTHKLAGQSYVGKILVLDTAKGGVASAWMLHEMHPRARHPAGDRLQLCRSNSPRQGAAFGDVPMLAGFDEDITAAIASGAELEVNPQMSQGDGDSDPEGYARSADQQRAADADDRHGGSRGRKIVAGPPELTGGRGPSGVHNGRSDCDLSRGSDLSRGLHPDRHGSAAVSAGD